MDGFKNHNILPFGPLCKIQLPPNSVEHLECSTAITEVYHSESTKPDSTDEIEGDNESKTEEEFGEDSNTESNPDVETDTDMEHTPDKMAEEIKEHDSREVEQEIDTIEICPEHPDFMVFGTYALRKEDDGKETETQVRQGFLQVMSVNRIFKPKYPGHLPPQLDRKEFGCAIWDIHFHPRVGDLLAVATSNADMHFYRLVINGDVVERRISAQLVHIGSISFNDSDPYDVTPSITRFAWLPEIMEVENMLQVNLAIALTTGTITVFRTALPLTYQESNDALEVSSVTVHTHDFQAWALAFAPLSQSSFATNQILISGGDDSTLRASSLIFNHPAYSKHPLAHPVVATKKDRKSHASGIVSVLTVDSLLILHTHSDGTESPPTRVIPVFTGSYDDHIRVFELDIAKSRSIDGSIPPVLKLAAELNLGGGIWRMKIMDDYTVVYRPVFPFTSADSSDSYNNDAGSNDANAPIAYERNIILLISAMYAGVKVVRARHMPYIPPPTTHHQTSGAINFLTTEQKTDQVNKTMGDRSRYWQLTLEAEFSAGHKSIVYAADSFQDWRNEASINLEDTTEQDGKRDLMNKAAVANIQSSAEGARDLLSHPRSRGDHAKVSDDVYKKAMESSSFGSHTVVSTSYYDMKVCVWKFVDGKRKACFPFGEYR